jgi:hypothetical protein
VSGVAISLVLAVLDGGMLVEARGSKDEAPRTSLSLRGQPARRR